VLGYQRLDATAIRRVWPSAPAALQESLANARSYQVALENPQINVQGDTATVSSTRRIRSQPLAGRAQETSLATVFVLRRGASGWYIDRIQ
jgi:ketosteroid isomerase-like protein